MTDDLDLFFEKLTAPLKDDILPAKPVPVEEAAAAEGPAELEVGHFDDEHDEQISFFEKSTVGVADRSILESILGEPYHVRSSQRFLLCGRHYLVVDHVVEPPHRWTELLVEGRIFVPWPDILAADLFHYTTAPVVMVQPDRYVAGMILSYYQTRHGQAAVVPL